MRGNSRLKSLTNRISSNQELLAIAGALRENKGLVDLDLSHDEWMSDESWDAIYDSLKTHPTLQVLDLQPAATHDRRVEPPLPEAVIESRSQAVIDMLKVNMAIHTIYLDWKYYLNEPELSPETFKSYLNANRFRQRLSLNKR